MKKSTTKEKILIEGKSLLQRHGLNGFSFQDIANKLEIKKPSLYDHYSSKEVLVLAILKNYDDSFDKWTEKVSVMKPIDQIRAVFDIFYSFSSDKKKVCPILSLTADTNSLSKDVQTEMKAFIDKWLTWLETKVKEGQAKDQIRHDLDVTTLSNFIYSLGMGSQVLARMKNNPTLTTSAGDLLIMFIKKV